MPIYEYQCTACGHLHEALQKISADPLIDCPECSEPELKKKISAVGFRLKGSGWYETDFKNNSKKKVADESNADASKPAKSAKSGGGCGSGNCGHSH